MLLVCHAVRALEMLVQMEEDNFLALRKGIVEWRKVPKEVNDDDEAEQQRNLLEWHLHQEDA